MVKKHRAFLKWAGGKYGLSDVINKMLPKGDRLIEPFVGAGSVFLNSNYKSYVLSDINKDLINLYQIIQIKPQAFIDDAKKLFIPENNQAEAYYYLRTEFNASVDKYYRSLLFLYLNRHGYNGLCRYNKSGGYNVPFGKYKKPYFPEAELHYFAEKSKKALFICESYRQSFARAQTGDVIYCLYRVKPPGRVSERFYLLLLNSLLAYHLFKLFFIYKCDFIKECVCYSLIFTNIVNIIRDMLYNFGAASNNILTQFKGVR